MSGEGGRYQLRTRIATGGMGEVWRSEDTLLDREVAVKVLKREYADDPVFRARFEAEARHAAALHHPNVASVFDVGEIVEEDGSGTRRPFLVMELVPGEPLSTVLRSGDPMPPDRAADTVAQAADAIAAAHAMGIIHRDVKPANLLVTPEGTVKITDFGIARAGDGAAITQTGQIIGTPHYISPEQAEGKPASEASDVYALGVVLYECLAGRRPFARDTPIQVALAHIREAVPSLPDTIPDRLRAIVEKALAKRPEDRFHSATDLAVALRGGEVPGVAGVGAVAAGAAALPPPTQVLDAPYRTEAATPGPGRRRLPAWWPWAAAVAAVLAVVLATAALAGGPGSVDADQQAAGHESPSGEEQADDDVRVRQAAYVGRPFSEVKNKIEGLGLDVEEEKVAAGSEADVKDTVAALSPTGLVEPGTAVRIEVYEEFVATEPVWEDDEDEDDEDEDDGTEGEGRGKSDDKPGEGEKGEKDD